MIGERCEGPSRRAVIACTPVLAALGVLVATLGATNPSSLASSSSSATTPEDEAPTVPGDETASEIYTRDCAECHGGRGEGTPKAPPIATSGAAYVDYVLSTGRMPIDHPDDAIERRPPEYSPTETLALAEYVTDFAPPGRQGPAIPEVDISDADIAEGGELYRRNCAACHQSVGVGGALTARAAPSVHEATAREVVESIRVGPFEMPAFGRSAMSNEQAENVSAYVTEVLQHPDDRGGVPIWHLGPVPEGAVAIVIGLGALMLVAVWIEGRVARAAHEGGGEGDEQHGDETNDGRDDHTEQGGDG